MECRLSKSIRDSVMLNNVFLAMDKAREKFKSRRGMIGRLIEISKFYELADMLLDGCLRIVEMEIDKLSMEVNHDEMLSDLFIVRDRLKRRLDDTELLVLNADSCFAERFKNELKFREALEMKEKEVNLLQSDLDQLERSKRKGHRKTQKNRSNQASRVINGKEADKSRLKNRFNQILEERNFGTESSQIDQLDSDIDKLKESMNVAFGKMQQLSKVEPDEYEWKCSIEKDVMCVAAKGLTEDFNDIHEPTVRKLNNFSPLVSEFRSLRTELEQLTCEKETSVCPSPSQNDSLVKISTGTKERPPLDGKKSKNDEPAEIESAAHTEVESGNYVARLISTHERIIQKKVEEQRAKEKLIRERWYSAMKKDKQSDGLNKKIQDVIARLDGIISLIRQPENISSFPEDSIKPMHLRRFSSESELDIRSLSSSLFCPATPVDEDVFGQIRMLELDKEDSRLQYLISEQVLAIILRHWMKQCFDEFDVRMEQLFVKVRKMEQEAEYSKSKYTMLEDMCRKFGKENVELYRHTKILERTNEDLEGQSIILEAVYVVFLTTLTKELHEELQRLSASKELLEEIVHEFTKML